MRTWQRLKKNRSAQAGAVLVGAAFLVAIFAPLLSPYGPEQRDSSVQGATPPSQTHWLGTDADQKDVLSRALYGSRLSLLAGATSVALAILIGAPAGAIAGYFGGRLDQLIMRCIDVALAFPSILIALLAAMAFARGWFAVVFAVGLINVPVFARQIRATTLSLRHQEYVIASQSLGAGHLHVLSRVLLPGLVSPLLVLATLGLGSAILEVAGLSFLGVGGDPTEPEWGKMLSQAKDHLGGNFYFALAPAVGISCTILGFNLLGDGLRDVLDPRG